MYFRVNRTWVGLLFLAAIVLAALFITGVLDWNRTKTKARVELNRRLANASEAVSLEISTQPAPPQEVRMAEQCRRNLRRIEGAKRVVAQRRGNSVGSISYDEIKSELGREKLVCPKGGRYSINTMEMLPTCSISGQQTSDRADDHILDNF
jgi:hypothetical protein